MYYVISKNVLLSDQEVTPQTVIDLFIQVVHYYIQEGVTVQFISQWLSISSIIYLN